VSIPAAVAAALRAGRPVLLAGPDTGRVVLAGATATTSALAWTVRHSSGLVRVVITVARADALRLPAMAGVDRGRPGPTETVTVDAARGVTTGISAADRARTARVLADPGCRPGDLVAPGHVLVELVGTGGAATPPGCAAGAAVRWCAAAALPAVAVLAEVVDDTGDAAGPAHLAALAARFGAPLVDLDDLDDLDASARPGAGSPLPALHAAG
jgi:3,4-dihydroxy-2-butanone 4-phosphate synthase